MRWSTSVGSLLLLWYSWLVFAAATDDYVLQDLRPGTNETSRLLTDAKPRIVGGKDASEGRYPYVVKMFTESGRSPCSGTLVAPDVVLTAAHCKDTLKLAHVGQWDQTDPTDPFEEFEILSPEYVHPEYEELSFPYDFMLLKLDRASTKTYILLNENPNVPTGERVDELTALGFGYTQQGDSSSEPTVLQEVDLTYVSNAVCEQAKDPRVAGGYLGLITDDMLCASDNGQDACQGDSGGPLLLDREDAASDVLVGNISWGFGCALPEFPGVYARISHQVEWIKSTICEISDQPPPNFNCGPRTVPTTVIIQFDDFPRETGWSIIDKFSGNVLVDVPQGTYGSARSRVEETVFLPAGASCIFVVEDKFGDGLCCNTPGNYVVVAGQNANGNVLVSGGGNFGARIEHEFLVSEDIAPTSPGDGGAVVGEGQIALTVVIRLDGNPQDIGWNIDRLDIVLSQ